MARRAYQDRLAPQVPLALLVYLALLAIPARMGRRAWLVLLASMVQQTMVFLRVWLMTTTGSTGWSQRTTRTLLQVCRQA
ncbi:MAG TPA: hypothetical protein VJA25_11810, partial [Dehalococcoidia bacterium]|nr:hypothetical protein [Dehalococcoidia bacterium]